MGGTIKLLDAKLGIAAHISGAADTLVRTLRVAVTGNGPEALALQQEVCSLLHVLLIVVVRDCVGRSVQL